MADVSAETAEPITNDTTVVIAASADQVTEFGEDMLQMALRMASEMPADEQTLGLAGTLASAAASKLVEHFGHGIVETHGDLYLHAKGHLIKFIILSSHYGAIA